jgi:hypothetical protein
MEQDINPNPSNVQDPEFVSEPEENDFSKDIDSIFGSADDDGSGSGKRPSGDKKPSGDSTSQEVDYSNLNSEQLARMFQSRLDRKTAEFNQLSDKFKELEGIADFVEDVYDDEEVRQAFLSEIAPDLVTKKDPFGTLEETLKEEFGKDYAPDEEEARTPLSKSWRYYKRAEELYNEAKTKQASVPKSLTEIRDTRKAAKEAAAQAALDEKVKVKTAMKWDETAFNNFANWAKKMSATDLAKIYNFYVSKAQGKSPSLVNQGGGFAPAPSKVMADLDNFFGK